MTIVDGPTFEAAREIDTDVCIVGAGAAGIAIAREFIGHDADVVVLAGGDRRLRRRDQKLYHGRNVGRETFALARSRRRMFGGSTTWWAGQCRPLDAIDFEARDDIPHSGWPFDHDHLAPFVERAGAVCGLDDPRFDPPVLVGADLAGSELEAVRYRFCHPPDFAVAHGDELASAPNVTVHLDAHVLEIVPDDHGRRIVALETCGPTGRRVTVRAGVFVLACGGIENARLLLASNRVHERGLGNARDLVGRYFMDHPFYWGGIVEFEDFDDAHRFEAVNGFEQVGSVQRSHAGFALPQSVRRAESLNGAAMFLVKRPADKSSPAYVSPGGVSFNRLTEIVKREELADGRLGHHVGRALGHYRDSLRVIGGRLRGMIRPASEWAMRFTSEQRPNAESRVTLDRTRDHLGMPRARVDWRLCRDDLRGIARLRAAVRESGIGRVVEHYVQDAEGFPVQLSGGRHHMGTTRMHVDPAQGVVDADCRVHDLDNLYVAGSSVFPTSGYANPTLTIVALVVRLADHLRAEQV